MKQYRLRHTKLGHGMIHCMIILLLIIFLVPKDSLAAQIQNYKRVSLASKNAINIKDEKEQIKAIRSAMLARKSTLELYYEGSIDDLEMDLEILLNKVVALNYKNTSTDSDYLANIYSGYEVQSYYNQLGASITYQFTYRETKKQTDAVNRKIKTILNKLDLSSKTTYEKVKLIHDYIVNNTVYDSTYTNYSAYNALIDKSSVCQGYALLTYKMLTEAGIATKIITGYGNGEPHAWNIVKINGVWYNLDCTWDDPITTSGRQILRYDYFLKNETDFQNHKRDAKYTTKEFLEKYPMAEKSLYPKNN